MIVRLLLLTALLFSPHLIEAAPAPIERHATEVRPGRYLMGWGGRPYVVVLSEGGDYYARATSDSRETWVGTWRWEPRTRTLTVTEKQPNAARYRPAWNVRLNNDLYGQIDNGEGYSGTRVDLGRSRD